jgi:hypothetical protein
MEIDRKVLARVGTYTKRYKELLHYFTAAHEHLQTAVGDEHFKSAGISVGPMQGSTFECEWANVRVLVRFNPELTADNMVVGRVAFLRKSESRLLDDRGLFSVLFKPNGDLVDCTIKGEDDPDEMAIGYWIIELTTLAFEKALRPDAKQPAEADAA